MKSRRGVKTVSATSFCRSRGAAPAANPKAKAKHVIYLFMAGGGVKGGIKHGLTDNSGGKVKEGLVRVQDFNATIAHALGLSCEEVITSSSGRPFSIADKGKPVVSVFS